MSTTGPASINARFDALTLAMACKEYQQAQEQELYTFGEGLGVDRRMASVVLSFSFKKLVITPVKYSPLALALPAKGDMIGLEGFEAIDLQVPLVQWIAATQCCLLDGRYIDTYVVWDQSAPEQLIVRSGSISDTVEMHIRCTPQAAYRGIDMFDYNPVTGEWNPTSAAVQAA